MAPTLGPFERQILDFLLAGDLAPLPGLRTQLAHASVIERKYTGVGVFTDMKVPSDIPSVQPANFELGDASYELDGVQDGGGVVLFVRDGRLTTLEVFNWTDDWPTQPRLTSLSYLVPDGPPGPRGGQSLKPSPTRDFDALARELASRGASA